MDVLHADVDTGKNPASLLFHVAMVDVDVGLLGSAAGRSCRSHPWDPMEYQCPTAQLRQLAGVAACSVLPKVNDQCWEPKKCPSWGRGVQDNGLYLLSRSKSWFNLTVINFEFSYCKYRSADKTKPQMTAMDIPMVMDHMTAMMLESLHLFASAPPKATSADVIPSTCVSPPPALSPHCSGMVEMPHDRCRE